LVNATFLYDADGNRVKGTVAGVTTVYLGGLYEYQNGAVTKYYEGGAIRRTGYATDSGVFYVVSDQLHSTSVLVNQNGTVNSRNFYYPYGGNRGGSAFSGITTKRFTGQYHEQGLPGGEGLAFYNARWYDAQVGMFISADTLVPSPLAPQTFNRYAYVSGNPRKYSDPSGHRATCGVMGAECESDGGGGGGRSRPKVNWPSPFSFTAKKTYAPPYVSTRSILYTQSAATWKAPAAPRYNTRPAATAKHSTSAAPKPRADDGWVLKFRVKGDIDRRVEYVHTSSYATRGTLPFSGGGSIAVSWYLMRAA
jgi:RHS repeat-associated protein